MSDEKPFAWAEKFGAIYELHIGNGRMHNSDSRKAIVECWADTINGDFDERCQARERKAAAKALREAADGADYFHADAMESLGRRDGTLSDATRRRIATWLRSRAAAIEKGEA
jgi:hypothetical protein